jgi:hypothetical protein
MTTTDLANLRSKCKELTEKFSARRVIFEIRTAPKDEFCDCKTCFFNHGEVSTYLVIWSQQ